MSLVTGLWVCHSCHTRGNLMQFLREMGVSRTFIEMRYRPVIDDLQKYAVPSSVPLHLQGPTEEPLPESLLGHFDQCPLDLLDDGFPEELLQKYDIGFDAVHQRITFPLRDVNGDLIGISGRSVDGREPRYKVYDREYETWGLPARETRKRQLLWNAHAVLASVQMGLASSERQVVLVEGFKANLRVEQGGISSVVAALGSYLSEEQRWFLERMGCEVFVMFDNDDAGYKGRLAVCKMLSKTLPVRLVEYPEEFKQPSDIPPQYIHDFLNQAQPFVAWYFNYKNSNT